MSNIRLSVQGHLLKYYNIYEHVFDLFVCEQCACFYQGGIADMW